MHVFVNPDVFGRLRTAGAQVVMSHEAVHVATDAARSTVPLWLLEGFADYVALRDVDLPISTTAGQIIRQVRRDGVPEALPGPVEFDTHDLPRRDLRERLAGLPAAGRCRGPGQPWSGSTTT